MEKWVDEDVNKRAWYLATFVPPTLPAVDDTPNHARKLLEKYGEIKEVRNNYHANFGTEGWTGKASEYHKDVLSKLENMRHNETNENVQIWLDEQISQRKRDIDQAEVLEEKEGW